jgi:hypothetical protein
MTSRTSRRFSAFLASALLAGVLSGCGADDVPDEGTKGKDAPTENPTTGGVTQ